MAHQQFQQQDYQQKRASKMPMLKEIASSSTIAWCPIASERNLLAAGTVSGTIDDSFQTSSRLCLYDADLSQPGINMNARGCANVKDADFSRIAWGRKGVEDGSLPLGLIAGGMSDGLVLFWNPDDVLKGIEKRPITARRHKSQVSGLAFHPNQVNLIASGCSNGELLIWDLQNLEAPVSSSPGAVAQARHQSIADIAWNQKVPHILASATQQGETSVWDLRQQRAVITFNESTHMHVPATSITWNPTQARQLVIAYSNPSAEIWDLRYSMTPKHKLEGGHTRGILSVSWNPHDHDFLLTSGEDSLTCLWSPEGELLDTIQDHDASFCIRWNPHVPGILAASTYGGKVAVRSISNTGRHVPNWHGHPVGATFGFGSRLVSFGNGRTGTSVRLHRVVTEKSLVLAANSFQSQVANADLRSFCEQKAALSDDNKSEQATWQILGLLFDAEPKRSILTRLGIKVPASTQLLTSDGSGSGSGSRKVSSTENEVSDEDFFNNLSRNESKRSPSECSSALHSPTVSTSVAAAAAKAARAVEEEEKEHDEVADAVLAGEFSTAVRLCMSLGRKADALLLASLGGAELWQQTQQLYMEHHPKRFMRTVARAIADGNIGSYVDSSDVERWRETLALVMTYVAPDQYSEMIGRLGARLEAYREHHAAVICYLIAMNVDGAASVWHKATLQSVEGHSLSLHHTVEKLYVLSQAAALAGRGSGSFTSVVYSEYAGLLTSQGEMFSALNFINFTNAASASGSDHFATDQLAFRIYYSGAAPSDFPPPPQPFSVVPVHGDASGRRDLPPETRHWSPAPQGPNRPRTISQPPLRQQARPAAAAYRRGSPQNRPSQAAPARRPFPAQHQPRQPPPSGRSLPVPPARRMPGRPQRVSPSIAPGGAQRGAPPSPTRALPPPARRSAAGPPPSRRMPLQPSARRALPPQAAASPGFGQGPPPARRTHHPQSSPPGYRSAPPPGYRSAPPPARRMPPQAASPSVRSAPPPARRMPPQASPLGVRSAPSPARRMPPQAAPSRFGAPSPARRMPPQAAPAGFGAPPPARRMPPQAAPSGFGAPPPARRMPPQAGAPPPSRRMPPQPAPSGFGAPPPARRMPPQAGAPPPARRMPPAARRMPPQAASPGLRSAPPPARRLPSQAPSPGLGSAPPPARRMPSRAASPGFGSAPPPARRMPPQLGRAGPPPSRRMPPPPQQQQQQFQPPPSRRMPPQQQQPHRQPLPGRLMQQQQPHFPQASAAVPPPSRHMPPHQQQQPQFPQGSAAVPPPARHMPQQQQQQQQQQFPQGSAAVPSPARQMPQQQQQQQPQFSQGSAAVPPPARNMQQQQQPQFPQASAAVPPPARHMPQQQQPQFLQASAAIPPPARHMPQQQQQPQFPQGSAAVPPPARHMQQQQQQQQSPLPAASVPPPAQFRQQQFPKSATPPPARRIPQQQQQQQQQQPSMAAASVAHSASPVREAVDPIQQGSGVNGVDVSSVIAQIIDETLGACQVETESQDLAGVKQRFEDLYAALSQDQFSVPTMRKFASLSFALQNRDYVAASQVHVQLITDSWTEAKSWLSSVKTLINLSKKYR